MTINIERIQASADFVRANQEKLFKQYPGEYIAVSGNNVVAHCHPDKPGWVTRMTEELGNRGLDITSVYAKVLLAPADEFTAYDLSKLPNR